jgi:hypothetical protein
MDLEQRIKPSVIDMYKRILAVKELPETLLLKHLRYKTMLDRVDAHLSLCKMVDLALECGYNPETKQFGQMARPAELDAVIAETIPATTAAEVSPTSLPERALAKGTRVELFNDGQLVKGTVLEAALSGDKLMYTVEIVPGDDPVVVGEADLDAVK